MAVRKSLSTKKDAKGYSQIMLLVEKGRQGRFRLKSGIFVPVEYWNEKKNDLIIPRKIGSSTLQELQTLRDTLNRTIVNIESIIRIYQDEADKVFIETVLPLLSDLNGTITEEKINELLKNKDVTKVESKDIYTLVTDYLKRDFSEGRKRHIRVVFRSMCKYELYRNKIVHKHFNWNLDTTTKKDIEDFFEFLSNEHYYSEKYEKVFSKIEYNDSIKPKTIERATVERGENRLIGMKKTVKSFWNWLIKSGITNNNPFVGIEIGVDKYGTPFYLTLEERNTIANYDLSEKPKLAIQRDIFIFHCLVGCRVGDLMSFNYNNIINEMLVYTPHKTKDESRSFTVKVPLTEKALELLDKYKNVDSKGRLFPFISEQKYNTAIKKFLTECKINRMVSVRNSLTGEIEMKPINEVGSSHMARRTFVGNIYKVVQDPDLIGKMSGHVEGSRAFSRYRDIEEETLRSVIEKIN